jgi:hypothetical protein
MTLLKKSKTAVPAIATITLIALAIVGFTYAHWSETLWLNGKVTTGNMCAEFEQGSVIQKDPFGPNNDYTCDIGLKNVRQINKNIGHTNCTLIDTNNDGCLDTLKIDMGSVYPCYYEHIGFWIHNCGTIPWRIWRVIFNPGNVILYEAKYLTLDLNGDGKDDVEMYWGDWFGDQRDPCEKADLSFALHILQPIPENTTLTFTITIEIVNWNEYPPQ